MDGGDYSGVAVGRQILLNKKLKGKPGLQRFDSGEYFLNAGRAAPAADGHTGNASRASEPPPPPAQPAQPAQPDTHTASTPASKYSGVAVGRQMLLNKKLREKPGRQRFDSGEYFSNRTGATAATGVDSSMPIATEEAEQQPQAPPEAPATSSGGSKYGDMSVGRQMLLNKKLREKPGLKRFDSGEYFSSSSSGNSVNAAAAAAVAPPSSIGNVGAGSTAAAATEPAAAAGPGKSKYGDVAVGRQMLLNKKLREKPGRQRFDSGEYFSNRTGATAATGVDSSMPIATEEAEQQPQAPPEAPATSSGGSKYGDMSVGRQMLLNKKLREKPGLKRFDSGEYFSSSSSGNSVNAAAAAAVAPPSSIGNVGAGSTAAAATEPAAAAGPGKSKYGDVAVGRQMLLNKKLREKPGRQRFDSGEYFSNKTGAESAAAKGKSLYSTNM